MRTNRHSRKATVCGSCAMNPTAYNQSKKVILGMIVPNVITSPFVRNATRRTLLTPIDSLKLKWLWGRAHPRTAMIWLTKPTWGARCAIYRSLMLVSESTPVWIRNAVQIHPLARQLTGVKNAKKRLNMITNARESTAPQGSPSMWARSKKTRWPQIRGSSTWTSCSRSITILIMRMSSLMALLLDLDTLLLSRRTSVLLMKKSYCLMIKNSIT